MLNYADIEKKLDSLGQFNEGTGVERGTKLLKALGSPEKDLKIIHVAGTNGKGSVCSYIEAILRKAGYKVGLFTSPHLNTIRERIQLNRKLISEKDFEQAFNEVYENINKNNIKLAYFDFFLGVAMLYFSKQKVDYVVMETGLGGRLDATNAVMPICSVITAIGLEHTAILGDTLEKIAKEKAGIIKDNIPVVYTDNDSQVSEVIKNKAQECNSYAYGVANNQYSIVKNLNGCIDFLMHNEYYINDCFHLTTPAVYQVENVALALTVVGVLKNTYDLKVDEDSIRKALADNVWQGRMEKVTANIYVDGAHNPHGINKFVESVNSMYNNDAQQFADSALLFSVVSDKDFEEMIKCLCSSCVFKRIAVTVTGGKRKLSTDYIKEAFSRHTDIKIEVYNSAKEAILALKQEKMIFCTGSLYLVADIKEALQQIIQIGE